MKKLVCILIIILCSINLLFGDPITGTYTIGSGGDYATFTDAVTALASGVGSGGVTFNVLSGTYTEQVTIGEITGASVANSILFQAATGATINLQYAATGSGDNWVVLFNSADYVTFKNLTVTSLGSSYGRLFVLQNGANNNNILDNEIVGLSATSNTIDLAVIYSSSGSIDSDNTISGNTITNGSFGIFFDGTASTYEDNNVIQENDIQGFYSTGVKMSFQTDTQFIANKLSTISTVNWCYGIVLYFCDNAVQVLQNSVHLSTTGGAYSLFINYCSGTAGQPQLYANNFLSPSGGTSAAYGIIAQFDSYCDIYQNSINSISGGISYPSLYFYSDNSSDYGNIRVRNNIVANICGGVVIDIAANAVSANYITAMDYNDLYATGTNLANYGGTLCADLTDWQTASGFDTNSLSIDPLFTSSTDLHINQLALVGSCPRLPGVLVDIDGDSRSNPTDMGADEYQDFSIADPSNYHNDWLYTLQNSPNPFHGGTSILFSVRESQSAEDIVISIYNVKGELVKRLTPENKDFLPNMEVYWDCNDEQGKQVAPGAYFYKFEYSGHAVVKKMIKIQ